MQVKLSPQLQPCCSLGQLIESGKSRSVSGVDKEVRARYCPKLRQKSEYPKPVDLIDLRCHIHPMRMQENQLDLRHKAVQSTSVGSSKVSPDPVEKELATKVQLYLKKARVLNFRR